MTTWIDHLSVIAEDHGLSLAEFLVIDVIRTAFPMTEDEVVGFTARFLPDADARVVERCIQKAWLTRSPLDGTLQITFKGALVAEQIAGELHQHI